jgi:hypothetical protein
MVIGCVISLRMGSHVANPVFPFSGRIRKIHTEFTGGIFYDSLAAIALLDNSVTPASIKFAPSLGHENALITLS